MPDSHTARQIAKAIAKDEKKLVEIVSQMLEIVNSIDTASAD